MTQDPIRDGLNWQTYLGGVSDPINMFDMWGFAAGDPFTTKEEAANDWGKTYNDDSIATKKEYGSTIYSLNNRKGETVYSYNAPNTGFDKGVNPNIVIPEKANAETTIHSHADYGKNPDAQKGDRAPSSIDYSVASKQKSTSYLTNSRGELIEYNGNTNSYTIRNNTLPSDANNPNNNGNIVDSKNYKKDPTCSKEESKC